MLTVSNTTAATRSRDCGDPKLSIPVRIWPGAAAVLPKRAKTCHRLLSDKTQSLPSTSVSLLDKLKGDVPLARCRVTTEVAVIRAVVTSEGRPDHEAVVRRAARVYRVTVLSAQDSRCTCRCAPSLALC